MVDYKLRYFNLRGRAEPIRWIFHYTGMEFEDERISSEDWQEIKPTTTYGQMPILDFEGKEIFGSLSIARFLARLFGLCGQDDVEAAKCDELVDAMSDLLNIALKYFFEKDDEKKEELKNGLIETSIPKYFAIFEHTIEQREGGKYLVEEGVTWADIFIVAWFEAFFLLDEAILEPYPHLKDLNEEVRELPGIKEWLENRPETSF